MSRWEVSLQVLRDATMLAPNVSGLTLTYYDQNYNVTATIADVRRIGIQLDVDVPAQGTMTLRSEVFPRSFIYTNFQ